jgi:hypothetical protein
MRLLLDTHTLLWYVVGDPHRALRWPPCHCLSGVHLTTKSQGN